MRNVGCYIDVCLNWTSFNESDRLGFAGNQNKFCSVSFPEIFYWKKKAVSNCLSKNIYKYTCVCFQLQVVSELLDLLS